MDCQTTNIFEITKEYAALTANSMIDLDKDLEEQLLKLDSVYNNLLKTAKKDLPTNYEPEKKIPKRQSRAKNGQVGDLFATESGFQQPTAPPPRRTRRQASMIAEKTMNIRESAAISSGTSRTSRARALMDTFMDIAPLDLPKANSTFVVDKKFMENVDECLSPEMFSLKNGKNKKINKTYIMSPTQPTAMNVTKNLVNTEIPDEETPISVKNNLSGKTIGSKKKSDEFPVKNKRREKLEDIDVNISEPSLMTRTMKRKLQVENQIDAKKTNVVLVPLEKKMTPLIPSEEAMPTPHQIRENEAEKRKELYLKSKADQKYSKLLKEKVDDKHLKVAQQREEQMKRDEEKVKKAAEEKKKKAEKQKERELLIKEEAVKKQKLAELRVAEINAKRKQAEEAKLLKLQKIEKERKLKETETKKKFESKQEKIKSIIPSKVITPNIPSSSKVATAQKTKIEETEINTNDYGLNDVSARDSSDDESGPKKPVPSWALRENRRVKLEIQSGVDSTVRDIFFDCPTSMSIKEMFKGLNIRDKPRTSSAVWEIPPNYNEYISNNHRY